jgi:hypothetical protein
VDWNIDRLRKKSGFVIANPAPASSLRGRGSEATLQSGLSKAKNEIASLPSVARNDIFLFFRNLIIILRKNPASIRFRHYVNFDIGNGSGGF